MKIDQKIWRKQVSTGPCDNETILPTRTRVTHIKKQVGQMIIATNPVNQQ